MPVRETYVLMPPDTAALLYLVTLVAIVIGAWGLVRRFRRAGAFEALRSAPGGPLAAFGRLARLGVLQGRMLRRPRDWSHAGVVGGTLVATLGTLLVLVDWDVLRPFGRRILEGPPYLLFEAVLDAGGLLLVVGALAGLLWRALRPSGQPRRIGRQHVAALAVLLVIGLSGFALEALRLTLRPGPGGQWSFIGQAFAPLIAPVAHGAHGHAAYVAVWWGHVTVALVALVAVSWGVTVHVLAAPLNLVASTSRPRPALDAPFDLRELMRSGRYDVRSGASRLEDLEPVERLSLLACTHCGRCSEVCPAQVSGAGLDPRGLVRRLAESFDGRDGTGDLAEELGSVENLWACSTCGACAQACPALVRPVDLVIAFRRELVARQKIEEPQRGLLANLGRFGNPYGLAGGARTEVARAVGLPPASPKNGSEWLYWVGCAGAYDARVREVVRATVRVLRAGGVELAVLGEEEACTGDAARRIGEEGLFQQLALANIETLQRHGVQKIVTHCAHCFNTLKNEYPAFGGSFQVLHHTELIAMLLKEGRLRLSGSLVQGEGRISERVTLHDACTMARLNEKTRAPRAVLDAVGRLDRVEMERRGSRTFCCGAGGAIAGSAVEVVDPPAALRSREAVATGARYLAVECPFCLKVFEESFETGGGPEVRDVAELVALALDSGPAGDAQAPSERSGSTNETGGPE